MDETDIKVGGRWVYLYRAVDKPGRTVDFFLSENRDVNAAKTFLRRAIEKTRKPTKITLDAYAASHRPVREMKEAGELSKRVRGSAALAAWAHRGHSTRKSSANIAPEPTLHQSRQEL
jgi:transposase-like protein